MDIVFSRTKKIPSKSWGQPCSLCKSKHGVPIECSARDCKAAYHTTCAIRGKLKMQAIFGKSFKGGIKLRSYCKKHSPSVNLENGISAQNDKIDATGVKEIDMTNLADDRLQGGQDPELDYFWKYVDLAEVQKNITKGSEVDPLMLDLIYRYWMLLRTANNGQSLIRFSPSALKEREFEQRKSILKLRIELERVRNLSYMIGKREKMKASWLKAHQNIIKRTFSLINDLDPPQNSGDEPMATEKASNHHNQQQHLQSSSNNEPPAWTNCKKQQAYSIAHLQPATGIFDESDQLINDLLTCDQIYDLPNSTTNSNHNNLNYQERSTLERRRTLSLVRRINRQLKSVSIAPTSNPYAKNYLAPKRSDSPTTGHGQASASKALKSNK